MILLNKFIMFLANNPCEDTNVLNVIFYIRKIMEIAFILVPIVLIVLIVFDFVKNVLAGNEDTMKKNQKIIIKRIVYCILMFFVMPITNLAFSAFETSSQSHLISDDNGVNYLSCWANAKDKDTVLSFTNSVKFEPDGGKIFGDPQKKCYSSGSCEVIAPNATKNGYIFTGWSNDGGTTKYKSGQKITINDGDVYTAIWEEKPEEEDVITDKDILDKDNEIEEDTPTEENPSSGTYDPNTGIYEGKKYNLTDSELKALAYLCQREQGTVKGAAFEASLMANRFELYPDWYGGKYADSLYNYVKNSGWWANSESYMNNYDSVSDDLLAAVKDVFVNGNRTFPQYVDEHDCYDCGDIDKIVTDGKTYTSYSDLDNRDNYKQANTVIYNSYGSIYTFWAFPGDYGDPFGYTEEAYEIVMGN